MADPNEMNLPEDPAEDMAAPVENPEEGNEWGPVQAMFDQAKQSFDDGLPLDSVLTGLIETLQRMQGEMTAGDMDLGGIGPKPGLNLDKDME